MNTSATNASANATSTPAATPQNFNSHSGDRHHGATPKNFSPLVKQFLDYLKLEKHFSDYTVKSYGADLIQFAQFLHGEIGQLPGAVADSRSADDRLLNCESLTIREFLAYLYGQNYTKSTTARKLA